MTAYEGHLISIYSGRSLEELRLMLKETSQDAASAANQFNATGLSKYKEDKEYYARSCDVLKFVIANREFHDENRAVLEIN